MLRSLPLTTVLLACGFGPGAAAGEGEKEAPRVAQDDRGCAGVTNENTKMRELRRELGAYLGQSIPEELQNRVRKHIEMVAKLKAECDQQRDQSASASAK